MDDAVLMGVFQRIATSAIILATVSKYWPPERSEEDVTDAPSGDGLDLSHIGPVEASPKSRRGSVASTR